MKATPSRRKIIVIALLGLALVGAGMRQWAPNPSLARDMGTLMLVLWLPVIGNVIAFAVNRFRSHRRASRAFDPDRAFTPHLLAELTPGGTFSSPAAPPLATDERCCLLVIGSEGFTARLAMPLAHWLACGQTQAVELELLRPVLAGPRFAAGAAFRILAGPAVAGEGRVIRALP